MGTSKVALHGGGAAKVSGFYEEHWTLFVMMDLLAGLAKAITLEPPGTAGVGFEFFVERALGREWHQVKYQNSKLGKWSFPELKEESVLSNFKGQLAADPDSSCVFVSAHAAHPLGKLCDHAAESESFGTFVEHFLSSEPLLKAFINLYSDEWQIADEEAWRWLHGRVRTHTVDAALLEEMVVERARTFLNGDPDAAVAALLAVSKGALYRSLDRESLIEKLAARGASPRDWSTKGASLQQQVLATTRDFIHGVEASLVNAAYMARPEVASIKERLRKTQPPHALLVTGGKGCGKSAVLAQAMSGLVTDGVEVLTIDITRLAREKSSDEVGDAFGIPTGPAAAIAAVAGDRRAVLVLDSLDSLGVNRDKPVELFKAVSDVLREAAAYPNLSLLVSCRTEDLDTDTRLRALLRAPQAAEVVDVGLLTQAQVMGAVMTAGHDPSLLTLGQAAVLQKMSNLRVFTQFPATNTPSFSTEQELLDAYVSWAVGQ